MTVSSNKTKMDLYLGDGIDTVFAFDFPVFTENDIRVVLIDSSGTETVQTLTTHYTVSLNANGTGNVTMITAPASGESLLIKRDVAITQGSGFERADEFPSETTEDALDKLTMIAQQQQEKIDRAIVAAESSTATATLPAAVANKALRWNGLATALENGDLGVWHTGSGVPSDTLGANGDMYLDTASDNVYGPKASGSWGAIVANLTGATGQNAVWLSGSAVPTTEGNNGDMYFRNNGDIYGPKTGGSWGAVVFSVTAGSDGVFSGGEANVTILATDRLPFYDVSDSDNPKQGEVQDILDLVPASANFSTGMMMPYVGTTAPSGWVLMADDTIGNGSSGGTARANADTEDLFTLLWNADADNNLVIQDSAGSPSTKGASAAADYAANKRLGLPLTMGRVLGGEGAGATLTDRDMFENVGAESHTLSIAEMPAHSHTTGQALSGAGASRFDSAVSTNGTTTASGSQGGGGAHNNMQPTTFTNWIIKL